MRQHILRAAAALAVLSVIAAKPAAAQRILDWPVRTSGQPEAVVRGVEAVFWNMAAMVPSYGRGEVMLQDQRTPDMIGIAGFAAAGSWRLDPRTTVAGGYQHVSIGDIGETSTSPLPDTDQPTFAISEDQLAAGMSHALGASVHAGAGVRYERSNETGINESTTTLDAGFLWQPHQSLQPTLGATVATQDGGVRYTAGLEAGTDIANLNLRAGYGIHGGRGLRAVEHRVGITGVWRQTLVVTAGASTSKVGADRSWEPVMGASLRVSRYELGFLREVLANDFGAAYSFRFRVGLK